MKEPSMGPILAASKVVPVFRRPITLEEPEEVDIILGTTGMNHFQCDHGRDVLPSNGKFQTIWFTHNGPDGAESPFMAATFNSLDSSYRRQIESRGRNFWRHMWMDRNYSNAYDVLDLLERPELQNQYVRMVNTGNGVEHINTRFNFASTIERFDFDEDAIIVAYSHWSGLGGVYYEPTLEEPVSGAHLGQNNYPHLYWSRRYWGGEERNGPQRISRRWHENTGRGLIPNQGDMRVELERVEAP